MNQLVRDNRGQFIKTTDSTIYKNQQHKGHRMGEYKKKMCVALNLYNLPKEFVVHHIDGNKRNNDINNLAIMTITAHNRIHAHSPWNKGKTWSQETINKIQTKRNKTFLPRFIETYNLKCRGKKLKEIAEILGISERQVSSRLKIYKNMEEETTPVETPAEETKTTPEEEVVIS